MDKITFRLEGFDKLIEKFVSLDNAAKGQIKNEFAASALKIQSNAKKLAPVNLGNLRNSIVTTSAGNESNFLFSVAAKAKYAPYIEFGTGSKVSVPSNYAEYAAKFKGKTGGTYQQLIEALMLWVKRKGISGKNDKQTAFLIARSILRKGIRAQPFLIPAFEQEKLLLLKRIKDLLNA